MRHDLHTDRLQCTYSALIGVVIFVECLGENFPGSSIFSPTSRAFDSLLMALQDLITPSDERWQAFTARPCVLPPLHAVLAEGRVTVRAGVLHDFLLDGNCAVP